MRLFGLVDASVDRYDRPQWFGSPFTQMWAKTTPWTNIAGAPSQSWVDVTNSSGTWSNVTDTFNPTRSMRLFGRVDASINRLDRPMAFGSPFAMAWSGNDQNLSGWANVAGSTGRSYS